MNNEQKSVNDNTFNNTTMRLSFPLMMVILMGFGITVFGQNFITVQHGSTISQYTVLDSAIVHAQSGDQVYIPGGSYPLSTPISKKLSLYGAGHYPDSTLATGETKITNDIIILTGADYGQLTGIRTSGSIKFGTTSANQVVNGFSIIRCKIDMWLFFSYNGSTTTNSSGFYLSEDIIGREFWGGFAQNVVMEKCILEYPVSYLDGAVLRNNIFLYYDQTNNAAFGGGRPDYVKNCTFENNIVFDIDPLHVYSSPNHYYNLNCSFYNNLFVYSVSFPYGTNIGANNIINQAQNTIFVNQSGTTFSYTHDYHLKSTCPGKNAGTDGTDIGIYGTGNPYKDGAVPVNPHIRAKQIGSTNNTINVNVKVAAQDR